MPRAYYTYQIRLSNYNRVQVEKRDAQQQSLGEPSGALRYQEKLPELTPLLQLVKQGMLNDPSQTRLLGEVLFDVLFDNGLRPDFVSFYQQVVQQQEKQLLRVELDIDEQEMPDLAALPWEFLCLPARANLGTIWVGTVPDLVFLRRRSQWIPAQAIQLEQNEKLRISLVISAPPDLPPVEFKPVQEALENLAREQPSRVELLPIVESANPEAINTVLSKEPHIFHFIGHGRLENESNQEIGQIAFVDPDFGKAMWVDADYFSELFNQYRPGIVMLQACEGAKLSASQAFVGLASRVVQQNIPVVVAMQYEVSNATASRFARRFYQQLAENDPVDIAAQYGRRAIALGPTQYRKRDFAAPVIYMRVKDGYLFEQYEEESPASSSSVELRKLEAAMPKQCQVEKDTEVRVKVALHDSLGLRAGLPDYTESGDLIEKNDVVQNDIPLEFPVDSKTHKPLPISVFVLLTAPCFKVQDPAKNIRVLPGYDSGTVTFFLIPIVSQRHSRVIVEWFGDEQKNTLLGSLTLITDVVESQDSLSNNSWEIKKIDFKTSLPEQSAMEVLPSIRHFAKKPIENSFFLKPFNWLSRKVSEKLGDYLSEKLGDYLTDSLELECSPSAPAPAPAPAPLSTTEHTPKSDPTYPRFSFEVVTVNPQEQIINRKQAIAAYQTVDLDQGVTLDIVLIPRGTFMMGSPDDEPYRSDDEAPQHQVALAEFWMGKYPVTQAQWRAVASLPLIKHELNPDPAQFKGEHRPVEMVTWYEAVEFCDRLSQHTGKPYRLPSESQWEYACRASTTTPFHFGQSITTDLANYRGTDWEYQGKTYSGAYGNGPHGEFRQKTTDVGAFKVANAFGLYDMHGNVLEWCQDWWHDSYEAAPEDGRAWLSHGEEEEERRILRGGSWTDLPVLCRSAIRLRYSPEDRLSFVGFRVVCGGART